MSFILHILIPTIIAMVIGFVMIPKVVLISKRKKIYDVIDKRKSHTSPISRLGGIIFLPAMLIAISCTIIIDSLTVDIEPITCGKTEFIEYSSIIFGIVMFYTIGLLDDFIGATYKNKFYFQIIVALATIAVGFKVTSLDGIMGIGELPSSIAVIFTLIAIVGLVNSYNLIDGIDGLCGGITAITMIVLIYWFSINDLDIYTIIASSFLGTSLVFLRYNLSKGRLKIFMGDTGSLVSGFMICSLLLKLITHYQSMPVESSLYIENYLVIVFSIIFVPFIDTLRVFAWRRIRGLNPFKPDRTHLHHLIIDKGVSHKVATMLILLSIIATVIVTFLLSTMMSATMLFISLLIYGSIITYSITIILAKTKHKKEEIKGRIKKSKTSKK